MVQLMTNLLIYPKMTIADVFPHPSPHFLEKLQNPKTVEIYLLSSSSIPDCL